MSVVMVVLDGFGGVDGYVYERNEREQSEGSVGSVKNAILAKTIAQPQIRENPVKQKGKATVAQRASGSQCSEL